MASDASASTHETMDIRRIGSTGLIIAILGAVALGIGFGTLGDEALKKVLGSYLFGWSFLMAAILGCFGLSLLHHTVRGSWSTSVIRLWEAGGGVGALAFGAISFLPIAMNMGVIYKKWVFPDPSDALVMHKISYLNVNAFLIRFAIYFGLWMLWAWRLRVLALKEDETGNPALRSKRTKWGSSGMVMFVLTITLASTDWFMSIDGHWFSSIFGPWYMIGGVLFVLAVTTAIVCANANKAPYRSVMSPDLTKDLGNMCFAVCMLWIYFTLSQYLIIWSGNLPEFIIYYVIRNEGALPWVGMANVLFGWLVPWMLLLAPGMKRTPERLLFVVSILIAMRGVDLYWNIVPLLGRNYPIWTDFAAVALLLGGWFAVMGQVAARAPLMPKHDNRLEEALHHSHA